ATVPCLARHEPAERVREQLRRALPLIAKRANPVINNASGRKFAPAFTGAVNSQGDVAHRADQVRALGINGSGVRIGVLSDGVDALAAQQLAGELPAVTAVSGGGRGGNERTRPLRNTTGPEPGAPPFFPPGQGGAGPRALGIPASRRGG